MNMTTGQDHIEMAGARPIGLVETLLWALCGVAILCGHLLVTHGPEMLNDSYQYLSVAHNILIGEGAQTSIAHFDTERSWRHLPAPLTTFPPGYPVMIAGLGVFGLKPEHAALLISALGLLALPFLYLYVGRQLELSNMSLRFLLAWTLGNSWVAAFSTFVLSESAFTMVSFAAIACLLGALSFHQPRKRVYVLLVCANILLGLTYWIRYAGLFLFASTCLFFSLQLWQRRDRKTLIALLLMAIPFAMIALGFLRNYFLVGTWKGGNNKTVSHPAVQILHDGVVSLHHLLLGGIAATRLGVMELLLLFGALCIVGMFTLTVIQRGIRGSIRGIPLPALFLIMYLVVYSGAMVYLGLTSMISFGTRMFYPLLPSLLLLGAMAITAIEKACHGRRMQNVMLTCAVITMSIGYVMVNARSYWQLPEPAPHYIVERQLAEKTPGVFTLKTWIDAHIPPEAAIMANEGQATAYVLRRRTVSLTTSDFSDQPWTEESINAQMRRYDARYLILYSDGRGSSQIFRESPFLRGLTEGNLPSWLTIEARTRDTQIFRAELAPHVPITLHPMTGTKGAA